jgi:flagellar biosynthetic protein FliO
MATRTSPTDELPQPDQAEQPSDPAPAGQPARPAILDALRTVNWREPRVAWHQVVELVGIPKLAAGAAVLVLVLAAFILPGGERADPFEGPGGALDLIVKLGAVLALAYVSMAALKRYTAGSASQRGTLLEVLDSTTLGPHRSVYVVRAGEKRLVLGVTQHQITALAELDAEPPLTPQPEQPPLAP